MNVSEIPNDGFLMSLKAGYEELRGVEKNDNREETHKVIVDEKIIRDEPQSVPSPPVKIPPLFLQKLKKNNDNDKFKKFIAKFSNLSENIFYYGRLFKKF